NGSAFDKNKYPELAKLFPSGYLPDFRGVFLRGLDRNRGLDSESGRGLLSFQNDAMQRIYGEMRTDGASTLATGPFKVLRRDGTEWSGGRGASHRFDFDSARVTRTAEETRVKNIAVIYIIKAR
ncbi:phage tail protein, partial [Salmonella enterica subsp. enterica serovar Hadar]|nr:phage tail protein [Salmonella enterica subsp. enterica serovar Hadar]